MAIQHQGVWTDRFMGVSRAMGLLLSVSMLFVDSPLAGDVPIYPDGVQRAVVEVESYAFIPHHLVVKVGTPVELTFKSITWVVPHNVIFDDPQSGLNIRNEVPAVETVTVTFIPTLPGVFAIYCDKKIPLLKSHREKGQEGVLEVR